MLREFVRARAKQKPTLLLVLGLATRVLEANHSRFADYCLKGRTFFSPRDRRYYRAANGKDFLRKAYEVMAYLIGTHKVRSSLIRRTCSS